MTDVLTPDLCVVGGGPAGIAAALAGVAEGASVVLVEKGAFGGAHIAGGGLAARALSSAASVHESLRLAPATGISAGSVKVNFDAVREHIAGVVAGATSRFSAEMLEARGVKVIRGTAHFIDPNIIQIGDAFVRARRFVLAVGSKPAIPPLPGLADVAYATIDAGLEAAEKAGHLLILGAGPHALALAQSAMRMGVETTVLDTGPVLAGYDPELADIVLRRLRAEGITVRENASIQSVEAYKGGVRLTLAEPAHGTEGAGRTTTVDGTHLVVATGRMPDVEGLDLAVARVRHGPEGIFVNRSMRTSNPRIHAVGDAVAGHPSVARATWQGAGIARAALAGKRAHDGLTHVPDVTFTDPAIATTGLDEATARKTFGRGVRTYRFPFIENDRTAIERLPEGLVKVVAARDGRILGASIVGHGADEMIALWSLAIANRLPLTAMATLAVGYPTRSDLARRIGLMAVEDMKNGGLTPSWRKRILRFLWKIG